MSPLTLVQEAVKKAVPEIMELKAGCVISLGGLSNKVMLNEEEYYGKPVVFGMDSEIGRLYEGMPKLEILGREIRLSDILRTIESHNIEVELNVYNNRFHIGHYEKPRKEGYYTYCLYDLSHDSLSWHATHRPEVIDFLVGLLD